MGRFAPKEGVVWNSETKDRVSLLSLSVDGRDGQGKSSS